MTGVEMDLDRWPRIQNALTVSESGYVDCDYLLIVRRMDYCHMQAAERAETWEEMAAFYEWRLKHRADEMASDPTTRHQVAIWTDSMCYSLRRSAAYARGIDPGPVIMQSLRRPDLFTDRDTVELAG